MKKKLLFSLVFIFFILTFFNDWNTDVNLDKIFMPFSKEHLFGTDNLGRDLLSLIFAGAKKTFEVIFISVSISFFLGTFLGILSGYYEGIISIISKIFTDLLLVTPTLIVAIIISSIWGVTPKTVGLALGLYGIGNYMNQAESLTKREKEKEYIQASILLNVPNYIILYKSILLNIFPQLLVNLGNTASIVILQYSALTFIGLGADFTKPDWGTLLFLYRVYLIRRPSLIIIPTLTIFFSALFFNILFDKDKEYD